MTIAHLASSCMKRPLTNLGMMTGEGYKVEEAFDINRATILVHWTLIAGVG